MEPLLFEQDPFLNLPFDQYQRYRVVQRVVSRMRTADVPLKVLDVGGCAPDRESEGFLFPIRLCLPKDETVVLDIVPGSFPDYVRGSGAALPFADGSFQVVVSCDTLEHIPVVEREAFIEDLLRVSSDSLILIAPFAQGVSEKAEQILDEYITKALKVVHQALREHRMLGLPQREIVIDLLKARDLAFIDFPSGHVYNWLTMMLIKHHIISLLDSVELHRMVDLFYNLYFADKDERPPGYRHVFVISKRGNWRTLEAIKEEEEKLSSPDRSDSAFIGVELFQLLMALSHVQETRRMDEELSQKIVEKEKHISHLETLISEREGVITDLRKTLQEYHEHLMAGSEKLKQTEGRLAEYGKALEESQVRLREYADNYEALRGVLRAREAELARCAEALMKTEETLERFQKGRVVSTLMALQRLLRRGKRD